MSTIQIQRIRIRGNSYKSSDVNKKNVRNIIQNQQEIVISWNFF